MTTPFPFSAEPRGREEVLLVGPGFTVVVCAHGARTLASMLVEAADRQYCDGYRHGDEDSMLIAVTGPAEREGCEP